MQNNVTELTQKLLKSLDSNYNVTNMPEVIDIISVLERVAVTKELLETTRLGKYINELRRKTTNQDLRRRAKELLKKWRSKVLPTTVPEANGQIRPPSAQGGTTGRASTPNAVSPPMQVRNLTPRVSPGAPSKGSPPSSFQKVNPALQNRLVSPGVQRLVSPGPAGKLVSPQIPKRPVKMVSPGQQTHRLVSPQMKKVSPIMQRLVSPKVQLDSSKLVNDSTKIADESPGGQESDVNLNQLKKRPANDILDVVNAKRAKLNGGVMDLDFSDSSNSSFKDVISAQNPELRRDVIVINSDSNSSFPERIGEAHADHLQPKKRGRKKGSKNHKNLLDEAETSFSNKLAVSASRGGSKVKTTQEILAGIQSKNTAVGLGVAASAKPSKEDLEEKAAKLTERVSIIDQKLNANTHRNKNSQKHKLTLSASKPNERVIESGSVINDKSLLNRLKEEAEDDVVVVDDADSISSRTEESHETDATGTQLHEEFTGVKSLSVEEALAQLPAIDKLVLQEVSDEPTCTCRLIENKPNDFSITDEDETDQPPPFEIVEDPDCHARDYLETKYKVHDISDRKIHRLHEACLPNVNGNWSLGTPRPEAPTADGLYINVVPNIYERLDKDVRPFDSFKKYSVSEGGHQTNNSVNVIKTEPNKINGNGESDSVIESESLEPKLNTNDSSETNSDNRTGEQKVFREWYECVDEPSYNGDTLRILPYCIVD